jgi:chromosome segregation ATPase
VAAAGEVSQEARAALEREAKRGGVRWELEYARAQQEQLASEAQRARNAAAEANEDRERLERELSVFRGKESVAGELHGQVAALQRELEQAREELARVRKVLEEVQAAPMTVEAVAAAGEVSQEARAALEREAKRGGVRWEAIQSELESARSRALRLESILRHFYLAAVNPLTVTVATADLAASSQWLGPRDRENLQLLKQHVDTLIESVKVLKKQMQELEIDIK